MRIYLDNCCYNRPFDDQAQLRVRLETEAKLRIQSMMRSGELEYVWSDMLSQEISDCPFPHRRDKILAWSRGAARTVTITSEIVVDAEGLVARGLHEADALHVACAAAADADWFITTDVRLSRRVRQHRITRLANPLEFFVEMEGGR